MKNSKLIGLLFAIIALTLCWSCKKEDAAATALTASVDQLEFAQGGGEQFFTVECNTSWSISSPESFITVTPSQGSGTQTVKVTVAKEDVQYASDRTYVLVIRSSDGASMVNVKVLIKGIVVNGKMIRITNHSNMSYIGGYVNAEDSLLIVSNVDWELRGPDWIEAFDGSRWRQLSLERGNVSGKATGEEDLTFVKIRTTTANNEENNRNGTITICEKLTGEVPYSFTLSQVGMHVVVPRLIISVNNGICTDFVVGNDVKSFYCNFSSEQPKRDAWGQLQDYDTWLNLEPDELYITKNNTENTMYYLTTIAVTKNNTISSQWYQTQCMTSSTWNQPEAPIEKIYIQDDTWHFKIGMNDLTSVYILWIDVDPTKELYDYWDAELAWRLFVLPLSSNIPETEVYGALIEPIENNFVSYNGYLQMVTWAMSKGSDARRSSIMDRFISIKDSQRRTSSGYAPYTTERKPEHKAVPISKMPKIDRSKLKVIRNGFKNTENKKQLKYAL